MPKNDDYTEYVEMQTNKKVIENYLSDESHIISGYADKIFYPEYESQISKILKNSNKEKTKITISGAGTGLSSSRVPIGGNILSMEKISTIRISSRNKFEYEKYGKKYGISLYYSDGISYAIVPAGMPLMILREILTRNNLFYPPNPTEETSFIGGNISTNASGSRSYYYGSTRDYVMGMRILLPCGEAINLMRGDVYESQNRFEIILSNKEKLELELPKYNMPKVKKNSAGYYSKKNMDLIDLFIGSEGTLGIIEEAVLKVIPIPPITMPVYTFYSDQSEAINFVNDLKNYSKEKNDEAFITVIEFYDNNSINLIKKNYSNIIPDNCRSIIYFEVTAKSNESMLMALEKVSKIMMDNNVIKDMSSFEPDWALKAKEIRHALPVNVNEFLNKHHTHKVDTDICVPEENLPIMLKYYSSLADESQLYYANYGHIGDNHLHFNFLPRNTQEIEKAEVYSTKLLLKAVELGGTISAEHGVGKRTYKENNEIHPLIELMYGKKGICEMARLKKTIDTNLILNIGNIIPEKYLLECD
ncbi:MAG: FAD-binding oxidoreductase [Thermoplasmata archaeon]